MSGNKHDNGECMTCFGGPESRTDKATCTCGAPRGSDHGILCPVGHSDDPDDDRPSEATPERDEVYEECADYADRVAAYYEAGEPSSLTATAVRAVAQRIRNQKTTSVKSEDRAARMAIALVFAEWVARQANRVSAEAPYMHPSRPSLVIPEPDWKAEVCAIASELGIEYVPDQGPTYPGPLPSLLNEIRRLRNRDQRLTDRELRDEQRGADDPNRDRRVFHCGCEKVDRCVRDKCPKCCYCGRAPEIAGPQCAAPDVECQAEPKWSGRCGEHYWRMVAGQEPGQHVNEPPALWFVTRNSSARYLGAYEWVRSQGSAAHFLTFEAAKAAADVARESNGGVEIVPIPRRERATDRPKVIWTPNADAGDSTGTCEVCGNEIDEPHTWEECARLSRSFADQATSYTCELSEEVKRLAAALDGIANDPHCSYLTDVPMTEAEGQYRIGIADGHRCAAQKARSALSSSHEPAHDAKETKP